MANYREEQIRNNRRLARQIVGGAALLLALIGLFTVLGWVIGLVRSALDDSSLRDEYHDRLYGMVMLDPVAFDDASTVDEGVFKQAAIWGTVYQVQNSGGSLDQYERDPDTGSALIPALEIDTYIANLLGPDYQVTEGSFSTSEFVYQYDEEKQAYYVPVTSSVALYTPTVEMISQKDGKRIVTVGYVPTATNNTTGELSLMAPTEPTKYMDYVFTRGENRQWYLTALRESDMKVEATPTPAPTDALVEDLQNEETHAEPEHRARARRGRARARMRAPAEYGRRPACRGTPQKQCTAGSDERRCGTAGTVSISASAPLYGVLIFLQSHKQDAISRQICYNSHIYLSEVWYYGRITAYSGKERPYAH